MDLNCSLHRCMRASLVSVFARPSKPGCKNILTGKELRWVRSLHACNLMEGMLSAVVFKDEKKFGKVPVRLLLARSRTLLARSRMFDL